MIESTSSQEIEERDFLENLSQLPDGFILIKHPTPNPALVMLNESEKSILNEAKWIAAIDYAGAKDGGLVLNQDGLVATFKYFATGNTPQQAVAKLVDIQLNEKIKQAK